jgi:hypothetical protein
MDYPEGAALLSSWLNEGNRIMEPPLPNGPAAGGRPTRKGQPRLSAADEQRLAEIGAIVFRLHFLFAAWNPHIWMLLSSRNHQNGAECVGTEDAPFQV